MEIKREENGSVVLGIWKNVVKEVWEWPQAVWAQSFQTAISPSETREYISLHSLVNCMWWFE